MCSAMLLNSQAKNFNWNMRAGLLRAGVVSAARELTFVMSHLHRFYAPFDAGDIAEVPLPQEEAHHALRVARLKKGDTVSVLNGLGDEIQGALAPTGKRDAVVEVHEKIHHTPPRIEVSLAMGGLHQEKAQQEVIRRAVETGCARVCFWQADHSQKPVTPQSRWKKTAIEACKQCGRFYLPSFETAPSLEHFLGGFDGPGIIGALTADNKAPERLRVSERLAIVIGPEGDFSDREWQAAHTHALVPVNLGGCIFRSETAAAMLMTLVARQLGTLGPPLAIDVAQETGGCPT